MAHNEDEFLDPAELPGKLRRMAVGTVVGFGLLLLAVLSTTILSINHTSDAVGSLNALLKRGDCRSSVTADLWQSMAAYQVDLADLLVHAATPQGSPERLKVPADAERMKEHSDDLSRAAQEYRTCAPEATATTTTTKGK